MSNKIFWCKSCLNMSTRPRISFDKNGNCNACTWVKEKKNINWNIRKTELENLIKQTNTNSVYDCIVPVSGGKDGTYVTDELINKYSLNPLCITIRPALELDIGKKNLENFLKSGVEHFHVTPDLNVMSELDRLGFIHHGQGYYGWMTAVHTVPIKIAQLFGIKLIMYGEDGEVEYGGTTEYKYNPVYGVDHQKKVFLNDTYDEIIKFSNLSDQDRYWFNFPSENYQDIKITHYSYFKNWDPYENYLIAKKKYNLQDSEDTNTGTFTNFAHNDQALSSLHYYLMYLKFGFGRATQDAGIEIRRGAMSRDQAINLVKIYDGIFPEEHLESYLNYFKITKETFFETIDNFANQNLFEKTNKLWKPKFEIV